MSSLADSLLVFVVLANLAMLSTSHVGSSIRLLAAQGLCLGALVVLTSPAPTAETFALGVGVGAIKGVVYPWVLVRVQRKVRIERDDDPLVGAMACLLLGVIALGFGFWVSGRLTAALPDAPLLAIPVSLATIIAGLTLTVTRRKALAQVLGYVVLENGIFLFALTFVGGLPLLLEMGGLLEVFFAVFVMGIAVGRISREFASIDVDRLDRLRG